jgi:hypothetical protein
MSERLLVVERELPARFHSEAYLSASLPTLGQNRSNRSDTPSCPVSSFNVQQLNMIDCLVAVRGTLTTVAERPSLVIEQATSFLLVQVL